MTAKVSIITPTFNHGNYISQCINSVLNQTYPNWEMIIIDDASTDKTVKIINEFAKQDKRIKIICHKTNWGIKKLKNSYNQALKIAKGEFIAVLEGDDFWPKDKLEKQIEDFKDKNVVLSYGDWVMTDTLGNGITLGNYQNFDRRKLFNKPIGSILHLFASLKFYLMSSTVIIRKKTLENLGGFQNDKNYPFIDIPTYLSLALQGNFFYHPEILGYYRKQPLSSWFSFAKQTEDMGRAKVRDCVNNFLKSKKISINWLKLIVDQEKYLSYKKKYKKISHFYHYFAFSNKITPIKIIVYIIFFFRYFIYKIKKQVFHQVYMRSTCF